MFNYQDHAHTNAFDELAELNESFNLREVRKIYEAVDREQLLRFQRSLIEPLIEYIELPQSRRAARLRHYEKAGFMKDSLVIFRILAVRAAECAAEGFELADRYSDAVRPGRAYRRSTASMAGLIADIQEIDPVQWPSDTTERLADYLGIAIDEFESDDDDTD